MRRQGLGGSFWPTVEQELLLRAALLDGEDSVTAWREVRTTVDITRLDRGTSVLLPQLYESLQRSGAASVVLTRLKGVHRYYWYGNSVGLVVLSQLLTALGAAGVETLTLDAAARITRYYGRLGMRPLEEPIVWVRPEAADRALLAAREAGWITTGHVSDRHRVIERSTAGGLRRCALYLVVPSDLDAAPASVADYWTDSVPAEIEGSSTRILSPADELFSVCVAGRAGTATVQWVVDAVTILRASDEALDWAALVARATANRRVPAVLDALRYLRSALGAPIPDAVLTELANVPVTRREHLAHVVAGRGGIVLGNVPSLFAAHLLATNGTSTIGSLATFPGVLRRAWGVNHVWQLPFAAARRAAAVGIAERRRRQHQRLS